MPIHEIGQRWIGKFERGRLRLLSELKEKLEGDSDGELTIRLASLKSLLETGESLLETRKWP